MSAAKKVREVCVIVSISLLVPIVYISTVFGVVYAIFRHYQ